MHPPGIREDSPGIDRSTMRLAWVSNANGRWEEVGDGSLVRYRFILQCIRSHLLSSAPSITPLIGLAAANVATTHTATAARIILLGIINHTVGPLDPSHGGNVELMSNSGLSMSERNWTSSRSHRDHHRSDRGCN